MPHTCGDVELARTKGSKKGREEEGIATQSEKKRAAHDHPHRLGGGPGAAGSVAHLSLHTRISAVCAALIANSMPHRP